MTASTLEQISTVPQADDAGSTPPDQGEVAVQTRVISRHALQEFRRVPSLWRQPLKSAGWMLNAFVGLICLVALLAITATIPVLNILVLGYLMEAQARVARTGKLRSAFYLLPAAQRLGGILLAAWLFLLPIQFLSNAARDGWLLAPGGTAAWLWIGLLAAASLLIACYLLLALGCGGQWWRFVRPLSNARRMLAHLRGGNYWRDSNQSIREFVAAFRLPHLIRLGLLAYAAAYLWLVVPTLLFTMFDDVTSRWQVAGFLVGCVALVLTLLWLPLLLAHVGSQGRWRALFEVGTVCKLAGKTPFSWAIATALLFACSVLPLLYTALIKIRIPPHDARWDLMLVFLVTVIPARVLMGWVYHRATQRTQRKEVGDQPKPRYWLWRFWQIANGLALCAGVCFYVYFLYLAQTGGDLGQRAVWEYQALLLPFPF